MQTQHLSNQQLSLDQRLACSNAALQYAETCVEFNALLIRYNGNANEPIVQDARAAMLRAQAVLEDACITLAIDLA